MKRINTITENIKNDKSIAKFIATQNYFTIEDFINNANAYIKAIKQRRMLCIVKSVSSSGMSRTLKFNSFEGNKKGGYYRQYSMLFLALGYKESKSNRDAFTVNGCGMDMIFHTNYSIIHTLGRLGFITKAEIATLAQQTPTSL